MAETPRRIVSIETTRKWHALAERRRDYFVELYRSGRWRRYYAEEDFRRHMREVIQNVEHWTKVLARFDEAAPAAASAPRSRAA